MAKARFDLVATARSEMVRHGFQPDFPEGVQAQVRALGEVTSHVDLASQAIDLRNRPWSSIDNSSSTDLDQIEVAERVTDGIRLQIAIADVDSVVHPDSAIDVYASAEATSVYVPGHVFPMLPDELSSGITSLRPGHDRLAVVIDYVVNTQGQTLHSDVYRALVRNQAQLSYGRTGSWLEGRNAVPDAIRDSVEMQEQIKLQDEAAVLLRSARQRAGALQFDRVEAVPVLDDGQVVRIEARGKNRATQLIEELMIAANEAIAILLKDVPSIQRVVRSPERWPRIVQLAAGYGYQLPEQADAGALAGFLREQNEAHPGRYADLSLSVLKLMGPGEYVVLPPGETGLGHFGLATNDYTHSTAPNRRFADVVTQRLVKAFLAKTASPYGLENLQSIARNCTFKEDAARKVERTVQKCAAAFALKRRVGQSFRGIVTGVTPNGVFVRVPDPPIEGRLMRGERGLDVGDRIRVTLLSVDPEKGFIDFGR
ncbi:MAG TPA: RNB domain-containing ribonuclease [Bryobacteraceae bacterium]|nr:RNB domain-containing ribonuclease [Bryobacteraceae bacterium]